MIEAEDRAQARADELHKATSQTGRWTLGLALYDAGIPSLSPDDALRPILEAHRWGEHPSNGHPHTCPVCHRAKEAT